MNALLVIVSAVLFLALVNVLIWHFRKINHLRGSSAAISSEKLLNDLAALNAGSIGLGERLLRIERNQKLLAEKIEQVEMHDRTNMTYNQAIDLIKRGVNKKDLMTSCDLSETEAGLLMTMHKKKIQNRAARH